MKHIIICPEYPPAPIPPGGIGTYVLNISRLLAEVGETVHVIATLWEGAPKKVEELCGGRLIIHRVPLDEPMTELTNDVDTELSRRVVQGLWESDFQPQCFSWQVSCLTEALVEEDGIDVIEAQEFQAPLYYFQLRRALGLGPKRKPPCIVHLHSPTEFIIRHNEWDLGNPYFITAKRLEEYSITTADARLCPSYYLAHQAEATYGLEKDSITVIHLPIGDTPVLERTDQVWTNGTICYVGRLEPRKGVIEWADAVVSVADEHPSVQFEFIGADLPYTGGLSVRQFVEKRIPDRMKPRFHFRGGQPRAKLLKFLMQARVAVVPSRWENFPNTCVEAMCSGLPVIASPEGGMAEMIKDGQTGWLASSSRNDGLATALKRALVTPPKEIAEMGHQASLEIREMCDNEKIVENHLDFRSRIANQGSKRSLHLPVNLSWPKRSVADESVCRTPENSAVKGLAIVVTCLNTGQSLDNCLQSLKRQTHAPTAVVFVADHSQGDNIRHEVRRARKIGWRFCESRGMSPAGAKNSGIEAVLATRVNPIGFVFLDAADRLDPSFTEACESVLRHCPTVGIVSSWTQHTGGNSRFIANPCPSFPYQLLSDETVATIAVRTEALREAGLFRGEMYPGYEDWDLVNAIMASGWLAVTFPAVLSERTVTNAVTSDPSVPAYNVRMRRKLLARVPEVVARDAQETIHLLESRILHLESLVLPGQGSTSNAPGQRILRPRDILHLTTYQQIALVRKAIRYPRPTMDFVLWHGKQAVKRWRKRLLMIVARQ